MLKSQSLVFKVIHSYALVKLVNLLNVICFKCWTPPCLHFQMSNVNKAVLRNMYRMAHYSEVLFYTSQHLWATTAYKYRNVHQYSIQKCITLTVQITSNNYHFEILAVFVDKLLFYRKPNIT